MADPTYDYSETESEDEGPTFSKFARLSGSPDVTVKESPIAGKGGFARHDIPKGKKLGRYRGEKLTFDQADQRYGVHGHGDYCLEVSPNKIVDARNPLKSNWTRYINDPRGTKHKPNVEFRRGGVVVTLKKIKQGTELLVNYGREYWT